MKVYVVLTVYYRDEFQVDVYATANAARSRARALKGTGPDARAPLYVLVFARRVQ